MLFVTGSFRCGRSRYPNGALCRLVAPYQDKLAPYRVSEMAPVEDSFKDVFFLKSQLVRNYRKLEGMRYQKIMLV